MKAVLRTFDGREVDVSRHWYKDVVVKPMFKIDPIPDYGPSPLMRYIVEDYFAKLQETMFCGLVVPESVLDGSQQSSYAQEKVIADHYFGRSVPHVHV